MPLLPTRRSARRPARTARPGAPHRVGPRLVALSAAAAVLAGAPLARAAAQSVQPWRLPAAAPLPLGDPAYALLDEVLALVPVPGAVVGQRPWSRAEVTRIVRAVDHELLVRDDRRRRERQQLIAANPGRYFPDETPPGEARAAAVIQLLRQAYDVAQATDPTRPAPRPRAWHLSGRPIDALAVGGWGTRAPARPILPVQNGLGEIDATTLPPLDGRGGRPTVQGGTWNVETHHSLGVGRWLALVAQPRLSYLAPYGASQTLNVEAQRLLARAVVANVAVQAGIDEVQWGQAGVHSLLLSNNAGPLRTVSIGSDTAFSLPGVLGRLGRVRASLLVADLGGQRQRYPGTKVAAYKVSLTPAPRLELGAGLLSQFGGRGAPPMAFDQRAADLFPFVTWLNEGSDRLTSNKVATLDARLRLPELAGTSLYYELAVDDFDLRRPRSMLIDDSGHLLGLSIARLRRDGTLSLDVHAQRTSLRLYRHYQFLSGLTYRGRVLGAPIGPDARAAYATLTWRPQLTGAVTLELAHEERDPSLYRNLNGDVPDATLDFERVGRLGPIERRQRAMLGLHVLPPGSGIAVRARLGGEAVADEAFVQTPRRLYAAGDLTLQFRF